MAANAAATALLRSRALQSYLHLRRASANLFANDERALVASRERARSEFLKNRGVADPSMVRMRSASLLAADAAKIENLIKQAEEATAFIRKNLAQAELSNRGTWRA